MTLEILLLCDLPKRMAATVAHHIKALTDLSRHKVRQLHILGSLPDDLDLDRFDIVCVHYSVVACSPAYLTTASRQRLAHSKAIKTVFIQDEYRHVDAAVSAFQELGIDILFTCVPEKEIEKVYPEEKLPGVRKVNVLTGYVDQSLLGRKTPLLAERRIDVGYRARKVPAWLGELGQEKWRIGHRFAAEAAGSGLVLDISYREEDRLYGDDWITFLTRCKAMLGVESGASVFDFSGEIQAKVDAEVRVHPNISFEELKVKYFADLDGKIRLNQISPRSFEAAALRTLMILYEGDYSGRLVPWRHYLPLAKDHSNVAEILAALRDTDAMQRIVDTSYDEVAANPCNHFATFVAEVDEVYDQVVAARGKRQIIPYSDEEFRTGSRPSWLTRRQRITRYIINTGYIVFFRFVLAPLPPERKDYIQNRLRAMLAALKG